MPTLAPLLVTWHDERAPSASGPLRFTTPPGPALLRHNLSWLRFEANLGALECERVLAQRPAQVLALFDVRALPVALAACRRLAQGGLAIVAARGRLVPRQDVECFSEVSFAPSLLSHLQALNCPLPARWQHPIVGVEAYHPQYRHVRFGAVFSRMPEPSLLDFGDVGQDGQREGAGPAGLEQPTMIDDLPRVCRALERGGLTSLLLVDNGGDPAPLAQHLSDLGRLGAWFGPARRPIPAVVRERHIPAYTWFEPEDFSDDLCVKAERVPLGCAFVPVGMPREDAAQATERVLAVRELGYSAIVPRFFTPIPNTSEWAHCLTTAGLHSRSLADLDGSSPVFETSGYGSAGAAPWRLLWTRDNRWPEPARAAAASPLRSHSFANLRRALDEYVADAQMRAPQCQARDAFETLIELMGAGAHFPALRTGSPPSGTAVGEESSDLTQLESYPFVAWRGRNLLQYVEGGLEARLAALHEAPESLVQYLRGVCRNAGRRIHPLMLLIMTCARRVPMSASLPAALATEWLHLVSTLPHAAPDVADSRLAQVTAEALVALSLEDLGALAGDPAVGPERAARLVHDARHELGLAAGLRGSTGQVPASHNAPLGLHDALELRRATATPLFRLTARLAITLGEIPEPLATQLIELLPSLGLAFQIADDALGGAATGHAAGAETGDTADLPGVIVPGERQPPRATAPWSGLQRTHPELFALSRLAQFVSEKQR